MFSYYFRRFTPLGKFAIQDRPPSYEEAGGRALFLTLYGIIIWPALGDCIIPNRSNQTLHVDYKYRYDAVKRPRRRLKTCALLTLLTSLLIDS